MSISTDLYRKIPGNNQQNAEQQGVQRSPMTTEQKDAIAYFFMRLKLVDPQQYDLLMPDEITEIFIKREYAPQLAAFSRQRIDAGFKLFHAMRQAGHADYRYLKIDSVIGLIVNGGTAEGNPVGMHKAFKPLALPDKAAQARARQAGEVELARMRELFSDWD